MKLLLITCCAGVSIAYVAYVFAAWLIRQFVLDEYDCERHHGLLIWLLTPAANIIRASGNHMVMDKLKEIRRSLLKAYIFMGGLDAAEVYALQWTSGALLPIMLWSTGVTARLPAALAAIVMGVIAACGYATPIVLLNQKARLRQNLFRRQFPNALDILTVAVDAGLDLRSATDALLALFLPGPVRQEMSRFQHELKLGIPASQALHNIAVRIDLPEATAVLSAVSQSLVLGTRVSDILRESSAELRRKRLLAASEEAKKATVKMTMPVILLIMPGIFLVILGPIIADLLKTF